MLPTPEPGSSRAEFQYPVNLFLSKQDIEEPVYIGSIDFGVKSAYWLPGEKTILVEAPGVGEIAVPPTWLWMIDIQSQNITSLITAEDTPGPKFALLDISPDGKWVMYQSSSSAFVSLKNIYTGKVLPLNSLLQVVGAWWYPDGDNIAAVAISDSSAYSVYRYNLQSGELFPIDVGIEIERFLTILPGKASDRIVLALINNSSLTPSQVLIVDLCPPE